MSQFQVLPVDGSHNEAMLNIVRHSPINAGGMTLYFDKSPDIFKISELAYSECKHLGFFEDNELKGFASLGYRDAFIGGQLQPVFTFYNFYILPEARGRHLPERAARLFLQDTNNKARYGFYVTMLGNRQVESFFIRQNHPWSPPYGITDQLVVKSVIFSIPVKNNTQYRIRNATVNDIPRIVGLLNDEHANRDLGFLLTETGFINSLEKRSLKIENYYVATNRKGDLRGVCLAWDCSSFRRTFVDKLSVKFLPLLYTYRILEKILPMAAFPAAGMNFNELTITDYAVEDREVAVIHALLSEIYYRNRNRHYHFMNFGSCRNDDILKAAGGFICHDIISNIVLFNNDQNRQNYRLKLPYIDIAFL